MFFANNITVFCSKYFPDVRCKPKFRLSFSYEKHGARLLSAAVLGDGIAKYTSALDILYLGVAACCECVRIN
jgi:hypothetical protein